MVDFFGSYSGITSGLWQGFKYFLYIIPVIIIIVWIIAYYRNKKTYCYPVRIFRIREQGKVLESNFRGGYIGRKNSAPYFCIKTGKWWWQKVELTKTPNPKYLDEQDRVYYLQIDIDTYVQLKRKFDGGIMRLIPVEPDIKYGAILSIQRIKDVLRLEPTWKKLAPYVALIIVAITLIAGYAILLNTKCPVAG